MVELSKGFTMVSLTNYLAIISIGLWVKVVDIQIFTIQEAA